MKMVRFPDDLQKEFLNQMAQRGVQEPEMAQETNLREYAPRKYSARETVAMTIKLFVVIGALLALIWVMDVVFKN